MFGPFFLGFGRRGQDALGTAGGAQALLFMAWGTPGGVSFSPPEGYFLLVDLAAVTEHNPQLRPVLTLAGRQFRTSDGNPL
jgi:hypothetical protein